MKIGIPRALLYYRYAVLWETFFGKLGIETILSPPTDKAIRDTGDRLSIDENCLSSKLFLGHVSALEGKCDRIFIPRIADFGKDGIFCTRFEALYDICASTFRGKNLCFLSCDVDIHKKKPEREAYVRLATELNKTKREAESAFDAARAAWEETCAKYARESEDALAGADQIRVLVAGHCYNLYDEYIGKPILNGIRQLDAFAICSDAVDPRQARADSAKICKDVPWTMSRELLGAVWKYHDHIDGIILITAFPCGPDSMVNEMIIRRVKDRPILHLLLDSQDASAGIETRLESFIDIIRFRKESSGNVRESL